MGTALTALTAVAWSLLAILALLAAALFVPADYALSAGTGRPFRLRLRWLFGLVRVTAPRAARESPRAREPRVAKARRPARPRRARDRRSRPMRSARTARRILAIEGLAGRVGRLVCDLVRALAWKRLRVGLRVGTGDPAETGWLCALAGPLLVCAPRTRAVRVDFEPDFDEAAFDLAAHGGGTLVPARVVGALGRFALSRQGLRVIKVIVWDRGR